MIERGNRTGRYTHHVLLRAVKVVDDIDRLLGRGLVLVRLLRLVCKRWCATAAALAVLEVVVELVVRVAGHLRGPGVPAMAHVYRGIGTLDRAAGRGPLVVTSAGLHPQRLWVEPDVVGHVLLVTP